MKDLGAPVELFQLWHPELSVDFPPPRSLERVAHNLPVQLSSFLGRDEELQLGAKFLAASRLVSVTGPGGIGKTRLAYQLAADQLHLFPDGVWVVELAPVEDPERVPARLMGALGLREEPGRPETDTVVGFLRQRRALIVLDNCEQVVEAAAALAAHLLAECAGLRVLATTRQPLGLSGETVWALEPLAVPAPAQLPLEVILGSDAVALFHERAAEAKPGFVIDTSNAGVVLDICARVDGVPLAIELAAAQVRGLSVTQISDRLAESFDLLSKGSRADGRQASVRGAIAWSHELLSCAERTLFRRLAMFTGGFTLDAAEAICPGDGLEAGEVPEALSHVPKSASPRKRRQSPEGTQVRVL